MSKQIKIFRILVCAFLGAIVITGFLPIIGNASLIDLADFADFANSLNIGGSSSIILRVIEMFFIYTVPLLGVIFLLTFKEHMKTAFLLSAIFSGIAVIVSVDMIAFITDLTSLSESIMSGSIIGELSDLVGLDGYVSDAIKLGISYPLALSFAAASAVLSVLGFTALNKTIPIPKPVNDAIANIFCVSGEFAGAKFPIYGEDEIMIGRDPSVSHIVLSGAPKVSRKHCSIRFSAEKDAYSVTDFSTNGTYTKEGVRLNKNMSTPFVRGSTISLGNNDVQFRLE